MTDIRVADVQALAESIESALETLRGYAAVQTFDVVLVLGDGEPEDYSVVAVSLDQSGEPTMRLEGPA